jgi:hypothetical protein
LYLSVPPADDQVTSLTADGGAAYQGPVAFTTTHWSVVLAAQGPSPTAEEALNKLCRTYWRPIYGFVRRQGVKPEEAKDLTQGFFALLLERRDFDAVRKEKGRLRSYLLTSLKHFLTNEYNRAMAIKRGAKGTNIVRLAMSSYLTGYRGRSPTNPISRARPPRRANWGRLRAQ